MHTLGGGGGLRPLPISLWVAGWSLGLSGKAYSCVALRAMHISSLSCLAGRLRACRSHTVLHVSLLMEPRLGGRRVRSEAVQDQVKDHRTPGQEEGQTVSVWTRTSSPRACSNSGDNGDPMKTILSSFQRGEVYTSSGEYPD